MRDLADEYNAVNYSDEEIANKIVEMVNYKIEDVFENLNDIKNLEVYIYEAKYIDNLPQTVLKLYRVISTTEEFYKELVLLIDVEIDDNIVEFKCYRTKEDENASAEFINGQMGMVDGVETPIQENEFYIGNIERLLDGIIDEFSN